MFLFFLFEQYFSIFSLIISWFKKIDVVNFLLLCGQITDFFVSYFIMLSIIRKLVGLFPLQTINFQINH